ncbi:hypothetical protein GCM10011394_16010 [Luteimonas terricola]|uniref:Secreted protein n=1 Tax=Luteimonas terricola TaxID=645597 RepID=A0ABQ2EFS5_9GAMM|nr:hypothetical protein GCM10011394_16010 [Luteimonas terricola]
MAPACGSARAFGVAVKVSAVAMAAAISERWMVMGWPWDKKMAAVCGRTTGTSFMPVSCSDMTEKLHLAFSAVMAGLAPVPL